MMVMDAAMPDSLSSGNVVGSLFQPDPTAPEEYLRGHISKFSIEPERLLVLALLEDAVACFQKYLRSTRQKEKQLIAEIESWFADDDRRWIFSFLNVCDLLGVDPGYLRRGLSQWRIKNLEAELPASAKLSGQKFRNKKRRRERWQTKKKN
jgi:hypothetical protein